MIAAIKSEFRKLLTIRSTYILYAVCLGFAVLIAFYAVGFHTEQYLVNANTLAETPKIVIQFVGILVGLVGILMITHEYRYNTITYTLMAARRRWEALLSKMVAITVFSLVVAATICLLSLPLARIGLQLHGIKLVPQSIPYVQLLANSLFYCWGAAMFGAIIAFLVRVQAGAIVIFLLLPLLIENILILILKDNVKYLPFTSLSNVAAGGSAAVHALTYTQDVLLVLGYVVVGWLVTLVLFNKRDAN